MAAYEIFAATTANLFIANIKAKAEAYGWTIDFFGLYSGNNRLHLHNADGAHFEIWWASAAVVNIRGCTGYSSADAPAAQPGSSGTCQVTPTLKHLIVVGPHSIFIKMNEGEVCQCVQFGYIANKIGDWSGGGFISGTMAASSSYSWALWPSYVTYPSQVYINGAWSPLTSSAGGGVYGVYATGMMRKMPFAYCGGILPCPLLLVQINATTTTYRHPLGFAPDILCFSGGDVYASLEEMVYAGNTWVGINQSETGGTFNASPDLLIRLAA